MATRQKTIVEKVFLGRSNTFTLVLKEDDAAVDLSSVTRMVIHVGDETVDTDVEPTAITWAGGNGEAMFNLGGFLTEKVTKFAELIVYDPSNANGILWFDEDANTRLELRIA